jgi:uncharacterized protein YecT (DUF1311 family)
MKQYVISLALLIAALVAFPTSHANAQSQAEMNRQAAKDFHKADAELNSTYAALMAKRSVRRFNLLAYFLRWCLSLRQRTVTLRVERHRDRRLARL